MDGTSTLESRGDVFAGLDDVPVEETVEGGEEGMIAADDRVDTGREGASGLADGRNDGGKDGSKS